MRRPQRERHGLQVPSEAERQCVGTSPRKRHVACAGRILAEPRAGANEPDTGAAIIAAAGKFRQRRNPSCEAFETMSPADPTRDPSGRVADAHVQAERLKASAHAPSVPQRPAHAGRSPCISNKAT